MRPLPICSILARTVFRVRRCSRILCPGNPPTWYMLSLDMSASFICRTTSESTHLASTSYTKLGGRKKEYVLRKERKFQARKVKSRMSLVFKIQMAA